MNKKKVIVICGPTASGKTSLGIQIANLINGEIISADSMQIYKDMDIGSAKPTKKERMQAVHHLIDFVVLQAADHVPFDVSEILKLLLFFG